MRNESRARVINAILRQYMPEEVSNKDLFLSDGFKAIVEDIIAGIGKFTNNRQVAVNLQALGPDGMVACAIGREAVCVNVTNCMVEGCDRKTSYRLLIALVLHECGHRLFTDGEYFQAQAKKILSSKKMSNAPHVTEFLAKSPASAGQMVNLLHSVWNTLEDGFIELELLKLFAGYGEYLKELREKQLSEGDYYEDMLANAQQSKTTILFNLLLIYAKYKEIKVKDETLKESDPLLKAFVALCPLIDDARENKSCAARIDAAEKVLDAFWVLIGEQMSQEKPPKQADSSSSGDPDGNSSERSGGEDSLDKKSPKQKADGKKSDKCNPDAQDAKDKSTDKGSDEDKSDKKDSPQHKSNGDSSQGDPDGGQSNGASEGAGSPSLPDMESMLKDLDKEAQKHGTDASQDFGSMTNPKENAPDGNDNATSNSSEQRLENLVDNIRKQQGLDAAQRENDSKRDKDLKKYPLSNFHAGVDWNFWNAREMSDMAVKCAIDKLHPVYDRLCREFSRQIKDRLEMSWQKGEYTGKKFVDTYRLDLKHCAKRNDPQDNFDMCVGLVIDLSGSMRGAKVAAAQDVAFIMSQFCSELNIPLAIYGHSYAGTVINRFKEFNSYDGKELNRILSLTQAGTTKGGTRDGIALRLMAESLSRRPEKVKLLFVISDGMPEACDYTYRRGASSRCSKAKADINDICITYGRKGIKFITAGLLGCFDDIRPLWTDEIPASYQAKVLAIDDLSEMSRMFIGILKKWLD